MKDQKTFNPDLFSSLKQAEQNHFWFIVRRKWILDRVRQHLARGSSFLEIGCGTGNVGSFLAANGYKVTGCEYYASALSLSWPGIQMVQASAFDLPFVDNSFDAVGLFDVLEHFDNDAGALEEAVRVTKKNGIIFVTVPARKELWNSFDDFSSHKRRYHRPDLRRLFDKAGLSTLSVEYFFLSLYFPAKLVRSGRTVDPFRIAKPLNLLFMGITEAERWLSRHVPLPGGSSLIGIARKISS